MAAVEPAGTIRAKPTPTRMYQAAAHANTVAVVSWLMPDMPAAAITQPDPIAAAAVSRRPIRFPS